MTKAALASMLLAASAAVILPGLRTSPSVVGESCRDSEDCGAGMACYQGRDGEPRCMLRCQAEDRLCADGSACLPSSVGSEHVCYIGGDIPLGSSCSSNADCDHGVCVLFRGETLCRRPCHLDDPMSCGEHRMCNGIDGHEASAGFCHEW